MTKSVPCLNCQKPLADADFCPHCGQKTRDSLQPLLSIFKDFFADQLDLDNRLFRSLAALPVPGKLTQVYFEGQRRSHLNPFRFFFIVAILTFALVKVTQGDNFSIDPKALDGLNWYANKKEAFNIFDSLEAQLKVDFPSQQSLTDSMLRVVKSKLSIDIDSIDLNDVRIGFEQSGPFQVSTRDFVMLNTEELVEMYSEGTMFEKIFIRQKIKAIKDPFAYFNLIINNSTWMLACFIPLIALILKLLFVRRGRYYVEHLVFSLHLHTAFLIILTLAIVIAMATEAYILILIGLLLFSVYLYFSLLRFYKQNAWKTLSKYLVLLLTYPFFFTLFATSSLLVGVLFL